MMSVLELCGTVSRIRAMACLMVNAGIRSVAGDVRSVLPCCLFADQGTALRGSLQTNQTSCSEGRRGGKTYLGSFGPHHTPMPATALSVPFALHAPSEYTMSMVVFLGAAIRGGWTGFGVGVVRILDVD